MVKNVVPTLEKELAKFQLEKRHSLIDPSKLIASLKENTDNYLRELETLEKEQIDVYDEDNVRVKIDSLLEGRVGKKPSQDKIDKISQDGEKRYRANMPPGFIDVKKEKKSEKSEYSYDGIVYQGKFGDLILWSEIKDFVRASEGCSIILIIDDEKEDWWWIEKSLGKKTIGPRPELIAELCEGMGAKGFWMYNSNRFLTHAKEYLGIKVNDETIEQIEEIASTRDSYTNKVAFLYVDAARYYVKKALRKLADRLDIIYDETMSAQDIKAILREHDVIDEHTSKLLDEFNRTYYELPETLEDGYLNLQYTVLGKEITRKLEAIGETASIPSS